MTDGFLHQACHYGTDEEFVSVAVPFIRDGLDAGEPVLATTTAANLELLDRSLGKDARRVDVAESDYFGRRPPQRVAAFHRYWLENAGHDGRVRILAEPTWVGWADREIDSWIRMEAGLNLVLSDAAVSMICPYDARVLRPQITGSALRTHPMTTDPDGTRASPDYTDPAEFAAACDAAAPLESPPADAAALDHDTSRPRVLREFAARQARDHGLDGDRADLFVFAVNELATYLSDESHRPAIVRIWPAMGTIDCDLEIAGRPLPDPFAGFRPPDAAARPDDLLWIARQLCDSLEFRSTGTGVSVRLSFAGARSAEQQQEGGAPLV